MSKTSPLASHYNQYSFIRSLASFLSVLLIFVCDRFLLFVFCLYDLTQDFSRCITFCHLCYPYHHFLFRSCIINKDCDTFQFGCSCVSLSADIFNLCKIFFSNTLWNFPKCLWTSKTTTSMYTSVATTMKYFHAFIFSSSLQLLEVAQ
jgi:hypothetical protein